MFKKINLTNLKNKVLFTLSSVLVSLSPVIAFAEDSAQKDLEKYGNNANKTMIMIAGVIFSVVMTFTVISNGIKFMSDPENVNMRKSIGLQLFGLIIGGIMIFQSEMVVKLISSIFK